MKAKKMSTGKLSYDLQKARDNGQLQADHVRFKAKILKQRSHVPIQVKKIIERMGV